MFNDVSLMNEKFGNPKGDPDNINWKRINSQCKNILDEYEELLLALEKADVKETRDALCDIMVFTLGAYHLIGHDADKDMRCVFDSNMSKFSKDLQELNKTLAYYQDAGVDVYTGGLFPYMWVKSSKDQKDILGNNFPKDKFLKNINWVVPSFD